MKRINYNDLKISLHPEIYEPSEDTFQIIESLRLDKDEKVLEIGSGSGIIALECARRGCDVVCTDVNPYAVVFSESNYNSNKKLLSGSVDVRYGDLFSAVKENERFDVIIFNPPYLPTRKDERIGGSGWFDIAVDGGRCGLFHTFRFLENIGDYVKSDGRVYFVFSSYSDREKLDNFLKNKDFENKVVSSVSFEDEKLDIYRLMF